MNKDRVVVLGGDGFCGWPTALHLSDAGYDVTVVDNFSRRAIDEELGTSSLTPISTMEQRVKTWRRLTGKKLFFKRVDVARNYYGLTDVLRKLTPGTVVHFAEQRAAPYSMKSPDHKRYTVNNNVMATHNLLCALVDVELDTHVVHLGTMGVYGYGTAGLTIPEGYIQCQLVDPVSSEIKETEIYYPPDPGSIYHMTKVLDTQLFYYYNKNDRLRITDLHQGVVWGAATDKTAMHPDLVNRFDYDGDYGTVLNRFLVQGVLKHPLTVYGTGGQTRAFIHIQNMVQCIHLAIQNPPASDQRVRVWNQTTEQLNLLEIAQLVSHATGADIRLYANPRVEAAANGLAACMNNIHSLGLEPIRLNDKTLMDICALAYKHIKRVNVDKIYCTSTWRKGMAVDREGIAYGTEQVADTGGPAAQQAT